MNSETKTKIKTGVISAVLVILCIVLLNAAFGMKAAMKERVIKQDLHESYEDFTAVRDYLMSRPEEELSVGRDKILTEHKRVAADEHELAQSEASIYVLNVSEGTRLVNIGYKQIEKRNGEIYFYKYDSAEAPQGIVYSEDAGDNFEELSDGWYYFREE